MKKKGFDLKKELERKESKEEILSKAGEELAKEQTRKISIKEGNYTSAMSGLAESYITPYALALKATNSQIGYLSSFSGLIAPIAQIWGSKLMEKYSRKKLLFIFVLLQALMWIPMASLAFFFWSSIWIAYLPIILIVLYGVYSVFGAIAGPAWFSLMGDIVPEEIRGKYFSTRNKITGLITMIATVFAAFLLDYFRTKGLVLLGFGLLLILATLFRLMSANLLRQHYEPKLKLNDGYYFTFWQFTKKAPHTNFGRFAIFVGVFYFAAYIGSPFFSVYMLKNLGFSYITLMLVNVAPTLFSIFFMSAWGSFADKYGNKRLIKIGAVLVGLSPILFTVSSSPLYLILIPQLVNGVGWAAFNLASSNFIYDAVSRERRAICVAYYNMFIGVGVFLGAALGGFLAQNIHLSFANALVFVFILSGVARLLSSFMLGFVNEPRKVVEVKENLMFYIRSIRPVFGELYHDFYTSFKEMNKLGKEMM